MDYRFASTFAYLGSVAAATLAAALMSGNALAEGPIEGSAPFVSTRSAAEVRADVLQHRAQITSYASEYSMQQAAPLSTSGYTREQARADYIAARDEVRAMTAEDGGSGYHAAMTKRAPVTTLAGGVQH